MTVISHKICKSPVMLASPTSFQRIKIRQNLFSDIIQRGQFFYNMKIFLLNYG